MEEFSHSISGTALAVFVVVLLSIMPGTATAVCGDVTGEGNTTTTDALLVLKQAVGQDVDLQCVLDILDASLTPNYGSVDLTTGFIPDPASKTITSGGPIHVDFLGTGCKGYATETPDYRINYNAGTAPFLRLYFVGSGDTTMIVNDPKGVYSGCGDDSYSTSNPTVDFTNPKSGTYNVWIGSFKEGERITGTLYITELPENHP